MCKGLVNRMAPKKNKKQKNGPMGNVHGKIHKTQECWDTSQFFLILFVQKRKENFSTAAQFFHLIYTVKILERNYFHHRNTKMTRDNRDHTTLTARSIPKFSVMFQPN